MAHSSSTIAVPLLYLYLSDCQANRSLTSNSTTSQQCTVLVPTISKRFRAFALLLEGAQNRTTAQRPPRAALCESVEPDGSTDNLMRGRETVIASNVVIPHRMRRIGVESALKLGDPRCEPKSNPLLLNAWERVRQVDAQAQRSRSTPIHSHFTASTLRHHHPIASSPFLVTLGSRIKRANLQR